MTFFKLVSAAVAFVLALQTGCDLLCQHAEEMALIHVNDAAVPPCHGPDHGEKSDHKQKPDHHGPAKDCLHPQAADDNSKLQTKIVKTSQPAAVIQFAEQIVRFQSRAWVTTALVEGVKLSGSHQSILRI